MLKIVLTGPESSGKTTLAQELAAAFCAPWTPEFARFYLSALGEPYQHAHLPIMARGQAVWETWYAQKSSNLLVCDTDWTVIRVWEAYRFPREPQYVQVPDFRFYPVFYFLCAPDFPWAPDPLRENPDDRPFLFKMYESLLRVNDLPFAVLSGSREKRFAQACLTIQELLRSLPIS
ncbi:MAG: AAA family ATPase [Bacteroidetes bacterium]|nr:AAA family ATPase [Bacteroidota bacterium]